MSREKGGFEGWALGRERRYKNKWAGKGKGIVGAGREQLRRVGMKRRQREKWEMKRKEEDGDKEKG